jgi:glutathione peroxidase
MSVYDYKIKSIRGQEIGLDMYAGSIMLIVNTASKCGFTPQYESLQKLYETYMDRDFIILGFPCNQFGEQEPDTHENIQTFCTLNYGVSFPLFEKVEVLGQNQHPLFAYLTAQMPFRGFDLADPNAKFLHDLLAKNKPETLVNDDIKWNFTKFLINRQGDVIERFESPVDPVDISPFIEVNL